MDDSKRSDEVLLEKLENVSSRSSLQDEDDDKLFRDLEQALGPQSLFDEAHDGLMSAYFMFFIPDLRAMIKKNELHGDSDMLRRIVELPCSLYDILTIFEENQEFLTRESVKDEDRAEMYRGAMQLRRHAAVIGDEETRRRILEGLKVIVCSDENEEDEIVYGIGTNPVGKKITVTFRGSVTKKDFRQDARAVLSSIDNPIKDDPDLPEYLGVHLGFREYLYSEDNGHQAIFLPKWMGGGKKKEYEGKLKKYEIILEQVKALIREHPDSKLRVAGHSLGGALATLFALEAAADDQIPKPVTCITSGAPKVGNMDFLFAFELMERSKKLRCLQVANDRDPVTLSPPQVFFVIAVPVIVVCLCVSLKTSRKHHTQLKYIRRLEYNEDTLDKLYLDELNEERWKRPTFGFSVLRRHRKCHGFWCCNKAKPVEDMEATDAAGGVEMSPPSILF